jgi:integrase
LEGIVLRLAWKIGLTRDEIRKLAWRDVSFTDGQIILPDRAIPMDEDTRSALEERYCFRGSVSPYVVISERHRTQILPESISRLARQALDKGGLSGVSLADLRRDFNIRQLQEHGWPYADRVSGVAPATLYAKSAPYMTAAKAPSTEEQPVDESFMWRVLQSEGSSLVGLALWMTWKLGLRAGELLALTWDQVDLEKNELRLPDQRVSLGTTARRMLLDVRQQNKDDEDPHVLLTPNSRKPFDRAWLSKKRPHDPGPGRHGGHHSAGRGRGVPP